MDGWIDIDGLTGQSKSVSSKVRDRTELNLVSAKLSTGFIPFPNQSEMGDCLNLNQIITLYRFFFCVCFKIIILTTKKCIVGFFYDKYASKGLDHCFLMGFV